MKSYKKYYILLILFCLFLRVPYFFNDVISWDEISSILMGQWIVEGNLPELGLANGRPTLVFYFYASIIKLFGQSIFFIRFSCAILISITSIILFNILKKKINEKYSLIASLTYIVLVSFIFESWVSQAFYTEHLAVFFVILSINYLIKIDKKKKINYFISFLFLGLAIQSKYILITLFFPLLLQILFFRDFNLKEKINYIIYSNFGLFFSILPIFIIYYEKNSLYLLKDTFFNAPNSYIKVLDIVNSFIGIVYRGLNLNIINSPYGFFISIFSIIIFFLSVLGLYEIIKNKFFNLDNLKSFIKIDKLFNLDNFKGFIIKDKFHFILLIYFIFTSVGIILTSRPYAHYLILISIYLSYFLSYFLHLKKKRITIIYFFFLFFPFTELSLKINEVFQHYKKFENLKIGTCYKVYNFLILTEKNNDFNFYASHCHIIYWLLNKFPDSGLAHPTFRDAYYKDIFLKNSKKVFSLDKKYLIFESNRPIKKIMLALDFSEDEINIFLNNYMNIKEFKSTNKRFKQTTILYKRIY